MSRHYQTNNCLRCKINPRPGQRTCRQCHAAYLRKWRKTHRPTKSQRKRANCRSYAHAYRNRGKIKIEPCSICGSTTKLHMHHEDYSKPLEVIWFCETHHRELHKTRNVVLDHSDPAGELIEGGVDTGFDRGLVGCAPTRIGKWIGVWRPAVGENERE
jgi:hypothetical protein